MAALACIVCAACGTPTRPRETHYKTVPISPLLQGDERLIEFENREDRPEDLIWHSTNDAVLKVTPEGRVKGLAPGMAVVQGTSSRGPLELRIRVSTARLVWTRLLPLGPRTFLAAAEGKPIFVKSVNDNRCSWTCPGDLHVLTHAGEPVTAFTGAGRVAAGAAAAWFESPSGIARYDYATASTAPVAAYRRLLALYPDGDILAGDGVRLIRAHPDGTPVWTREFSGEVEGAVVAGDLEIVMADRRLFVSRNGEYQEIVVDGPRVPWATDRTGSAILSDSAGYNFAVYRESSGYRLLPGVYSVLVAPSGLMQSEGLTASLSVPVAALSDGGGVFVEMHSFGATGAEHTFDTVRRERDLPHWRWGPSKCNDHPFAMAALSGHVLIAGCDRVVRIDDESLAPDGSWPQPGADAGRSWHLQ